jgi:neutral ceramidase
MSGPSLRVGVATEDITPPVGVRMSGFAGRAFDNTGVLDPLRASVLCLSDGVNVAAIVTLDTIGLDPGDDYGLRQQIRDQLKVTSDAAILLACSHTHSGAATMTIRATGDKDAAWTREVRTRVLRAARKAFEEATPVAVPRVASRPCDAAINRRNPAGPRDPDCRLLTFTGADGKPVAALLHYAMHPVALGRENRLLSADWVAPARTALEAALGCPVLFLQGCCGDVNPHFAGARGRDEMRRAGEKVTEAALAAVKEARPLESVHLGIGKADTRLPLIPLDPVEESRLEAAAREVLTQGESAPLAARQLATADIQWARACAKLRERHPNGLPHIPARVSALALGDITLVGLPGEIFSEIGLRIRRDDPSAWPVGFANGNLGYLYPDVALAEGGYEVDRAYRLYGEQRVGPGTADALVTAARRARERAADRSKQG